MTPRPPGGFYIVVPMWWPLIGALIAFVLVAVLLGWLLDASRHGGGVDADHH